MSEEDRVFVSIVRNAASARLQAELDDLNNELAEREVGRQARFLTSGSAGKAAEHAKARREREFRSLLQQMLQDPEYQRLYDAAWTSVDRAQHALDRILLENAQGQETLTQLIETMEAAAARLPDGEKVLRAEDGSLFTASGRRLTMAEARDVAIPQNAPSYETYVQARRALDGARERGRSLAERQTRDIDPVRARLRDEGNPPSKDELRTMAREMDEFGKDLRQTSAPSFQAASSPPATQQSEPPLERSKLDQFPAP